MENKLLSLRIEPQTYNEITGFAKLWNLNLMELSKKFLRDSLETFKEPTLDLAFRKIEKGILSSEEAAKLLSMDLDEFEKKAGAAGVIDYFEPEEVRQQLEKSEKVFNKFKWKTLS